MAEGTPLERVQVVNSGARVQIPPSPFCFCKYRTWSKIPSGKIPSGKIPSGIGKAEGIRALKNLGN